MGHLMQYEEKILRNEITAVSCAPVYLKDSNYIDSLQISTYLKQGHPVRHIVCFLFKQNKTKQYMKTYACTNSSVCRTMCMALRKKKKNSFGMT